MVKNEYDQRMFVDIYYARYIVKLILSPSRRVAFIPIPKQFNFITCWNTFSNHFNLFHHTTFFFLFKVQKTFHLWGHFSDNFIQGRQVAIIATRWNSIIHSTQVYLLKGWDGYFCSLLSAQIEQSGEKNSPYHSHLISYQFDFLCSSWNWTRLPEQNDSKKSLTNLSHLSQEILFKYHLNQKHLPLTPNS